MKLEAESSIDYKMMDTCLRDLKGVFDIDLNMEILGGESVSQDPQEFVKRVRIVLKSLLFWRRVGCVGLPFLVSNEIRLDMRAKARKEREEIFQVLVSNYESKLNLRV